MSATEPTVTIVIAARPAQVKVEAAIAAQALDYPAANLELIIARGRQPSAQRNAAVKTALGQWIYFLDDDSVPLRENLQAALRYFSENQVQMIGGPNICPVNAPWLEQVFALVLSSWLAFGPSRARYARIGEARPTSEKELILCNLLARKSTLLEHGGFNEALYPNEENALMDEIQKHGGKLIYDPALVVYRRPRATLLAFCKMLFTYGRGRAEQFRTTPTSRSMLNFVPPLFCLYLAGLILMQVLPVPSIVKWGVVIPLAFYALLVIGQALILLKGVDPAQGISFAKRLGRSLATIPLITLSHLLYGAGFWRGLTTTLTPNDNNRSEVTLETLKRLGQSEWNMSPVQERP